MYRQALYFFSILAQFLLNFWNGIRSSKIAVLLHSRKSRDSQNESVWVGISDLKFCIATKYSLLSFSSVLIAILLWFSSDSAQFLVSTTRLFCAISIMVEFLLSFIVGKCTFPFIPLDSIFCSNQSRNLLTHLLITVLRKKGWFHCALIGEKQPGSICSSWWEMLVRRSRLDRPAAVVYGRPLFNLVFRWWWRKRSSFQLYCNHKVNPWGSITYRTILTFIPIHT